MPKNSSARYQRRLILFIDFLGFKELVEQPVAEPEALPRLLAAMDAVGEIGKGSIFKSQRVTQFSGFQQNRPKQSCHLVRHAAQAS